MSKHYGVNRGDLLSGCRNRSIVRPRQIGMYLAKSLTSRSLPKIGRRFGNRDHTTVLHAIRKIEQLMNDDTQLREEIELLKRSAARIGGRREGGFDHKRSIPTRSCKLPLSRVKFEPLGYFHHAFARVGLEPKSASARVERTGGKRSFFGASGNDAAHHRQTRPGQGARPCGERRRAAQHHPDPLQCPPLAAKNELKLTATDLDMELVETVPCRAKGEGATTVPAHMFHDIVRKLPEGADIELVRDGEQGRLSITQRPRPVLAADAAGRRFPGAQRRRSRPQLHLSAASLKRLIDKTRFAISTEETRYYLNGIYLHAAQSGGKPMLRAVATDGHRLAQVELPLPSGAKDMPGVIVPRKTVLELAKLVEDGEGEVRVELSPSKIRVSTARVVLTSKLIDGTFPDYERVIPQGNDKKMEVDNAAFAQAVDRVSTLSSDKGRAVKLTITDGKLTLSVNNPDSGSATEELPVEYGFDPLEIGFNARYLLDISGQLESGTAEFQLADPGSPTMVRDGKDASALYVLMPMRV